MEITGRIRQIKDIVEVGSQGFKKRDFVITTDSEYPQHILLQLVQEKCDLLDNFKIGDEVRVEFNLKGREWVNKEGEEVFFNTLQAWRIVKIANGSSYTPPAPIKPVEETKPTTTANEEPDDDLPF